MALAGRHPILLLCFQQAQQILAAFPLESSGFNSVDAQNPWVAIIQLAGVWAYYQPHVLAVCAGCCRLLCRHGWCLSGGPQPGVEEDGTASVVPASGNDRVAGGVDGFAGSHFLGLVRLMKWVAARTLQYPASRTWWASRSGPSFFRWDFIRRGAVELGLSIAPVIMLLEQRSALSSLVKV